MESIRRFDEAADQDYPCERHRDFIFRSRHNEMIHERGDCPFAPSNIKMGADLVHFEGEGKVWRFHPECVYENLQEIEVG